MSDENNEVVEKKAKKAKKVSDKPSKSAVLFADISSVLEGLPSYEKASFRVYGHKGGVRFAIPVTQKISRVYFYGDPSETFDHPAVVSFTEEERKARKLGGVTAEVDFTKSAEESRSAIELFASKVRGANPPERKVRPPKVEKQAIEVLVDN